MVVVAKTKHKHKHHHTHVKTPRPTSVPTPQPSISPAPTLSRYRYHFGAFDESCINCWQYRKVVCWDNYQAHRVNKTRCRWLPKPHAKQSCCTPAPTTEMRRHAVKAGKRAIFHISWAAVVGWVSFIAVLAAITAFRWFRRRLALRYKRLGWDTTEHNKHTIELQDSRSVRRRGS